MKHAKNKQKQKREAFRIYGNYLPNFFDINGFPPQQATRVRCFDIALGNTTLQQTDNIDIEIVVQIEKILISILEITKREQV